MLAIGMKQDKTYKYGFEPVITVISQRFLQAEIPND